MLPRRVWKRPNPPNRSSTRFSKTAGSRRARCRRCSPPTSGGRRRRRGSRSGRPGGAVGEPRPRRRVLLRGPVQVSRRSPLNCRRTRVAGLPPRAGDAVRDEHCPLGGADSVRHLLHVPAGLTPPHPPMKSGAAWLCVEASVNPAGLKPCSAPSSSARSKGRAAVAELAVLAEVGGAVQDRLPGRTVRGRRR